MNIVNIVNMGMTCWQLITKNHRTLLSIIAPVVGNAAIGLVAPDWHCVISTRTIINRPRADLNTDLKIARLQMQIAGINY